MISILLALWAFGCERTFTLRGSVSADADAAAIEDAKLSLFCPRDGQMHQFYPTFSTDAHGQFVHQGAGELSLDCELRAQKEEFELVDVPLRGACTERKGDQRCVEAQFEIALPRATGAQ